MISLNKFAKLVSVLCLTAELLLLNACKKSEAVTPTDAYFPAVKAIISTNCLSCHSSSGSWTGRPVAFDTDSQIVNLAGAIKAAVADPISPTNKRMPQGGSLSDSDINTIVNWYAKGGKATD